jgi:hypothetical protein
VWIARRSWLQGGGIDIARHGIEHFPPDGPGRLDLDIVTFADRPPPETGAGNELLMRVWVTKPGLLSTKQPSCVGITERFFW